MTKTPTASMEAPASPPEGAGGGGLRSWLAACLWERRISWSIGALGAIAEFHWVDGDTAEGESPGTEGPLFVVTGRGGIALRPEPDLQPIPWESLSSTPGRWRQEVLLCLPRARARMEGPRVLTELGPDLGPQRGTVGIPPAGSPCGIGALRPPDREGILFDLGLPLPFVRALVRTADPALLAVLRAGAGRPLLEPGNPALGAIKEASPTRIFCSRAGRIEVYQRIGSSRRGIPTPEGPHTHLLPALLARTRTHEAGAPVPRALAPAATLHPPHPPGAPLTARGEESPNPCDPELQARFDRWLERWGDREAWREKIRVREAVGKGERPEDHAPPRTRRGRIALRVALRQLAAANPDSELIALWRRRFDRGPWTHPPGAIGSPPRSLPEYARVVPSGAGPGRSIWRALQARAPREEPAARDLVARRVRPARRRPAGLQVRRCPPGRLPRITSSGPDRRRRPDPSPSEGADPGSHPPSGLTRFPPCPIRSAIPRPKGCLGLARSRHEPCPHASLPVRSPASTARAGTG